MEEDYGENIIVQLNKLNSILEKIKEEKELQCPFAQDCKYKVSKLSKKD